MNNQYSIQIDDDEKTGTNIKDVLNDIICDYQYFQHTETEIKIKKDKNYIIVYINPIQFMNLVFYIDFEIIGDSKFNTKELDKIMDVIYEHYNFIFISEVPEKNIKINNLLNGSNYFTKVAEKNNILVWMSK